VEFGPGMTSATEIRGAWPTLNEKRKTALVMSLYPKTQNNLKLAQTVVKMLDIAIGGLQEHFPQQLSVGGMTASYQAQDNQPIDEVRIHDPKSVDLYFHPDPANPKKKLVGRNIPARAIDMMIQAVCRKYGVYPEDFEWTAAKGSADPFGRMVDETNKKPQNKEPELRNAERFAQMHYPVYSSNPEEAFKKWVQRSLRHSDEDDKVQNKALTDLGRRMRSLENEFHQVMRNQKSDYVEETKK